LISQLKRGSNMKKLVNKKVSIAKTTQATQVHNDGHRKKLFNVLNSNLEVETNS
jgi:hypothetical protein